MAIFPQGFQQLDLRCSSGVRRVLHQLQRCLGDDYLVWHQVPLGEGGRTPDLTILSPQQGLLLLEVRTWRRGHLRQATQAGVSLSTPAGVVTEPNPLPIAREHALSLVEALRRDPGLVHRGGSFAEQLIFPHGWGVVFPSLQAAEVAGTGFDTVFPTHLTLLRDDLSEALDRGVFQRHLWGMLHLSYPHTLTPAERNRVRWHLFPELRLGRPGVPDLDLEPAPANPPEPVPVLDLEQEQVARGQGPGHCVVHGVAGSGKTLLLIDRAQRLAAEAPAGQPVLVLCVSRSLADHIESQMRERGVSEWVQVRTFHQWCKEMVEQHALDTPHEADKAARQRQIVAAVAQGLARGQVPAGTYSAVLVDEAHEFSDAWLRIAAQLVNPRTRQLMLLHDDAQSPHPRQRRPFNFSELGIHAPGRTHLLRLNYRNTTEVAATAVHCANGLMHGAGDSRAEGEVPLVAPASAGRRGPLPEWFSAADERAEADLLAEQVVSRHAAGTPLREIAVLCHTKQQMRPIEKALRRRQIEVESMSGQGLRHMDWTDPSVKLLTLHGAKGLEFACVFVAGLQAMPAEGESEDDAARLLYVGMTRATETLTLSAHGPSPIVDRVQASLAAMAGRFAGF